MSLLKTVLETKEAKEAIGEGLLRLIETGNLEKGISAMLERGNNNGSTAAAIIAFIIDALELPEK
jgi:hypothetical protein